MKVPLSMSAIHGKLEVLFDPCKNYSKLHKFNYKSLLDGKMEFIPSVSTQLDAYNTFYREKYGVLDEDKTVTKPLPTNGTAGMSSKTGNASVSGANAKTNEAGMDKPKHTLFNPSDLVTEFKKPTKQPGNE